MELTTSQYRQRDKMHRECLNPETSVEQVVRSECAGNMIERVEVSIDELVWKLEKTRGTLFNYLGIIEDGLVALLKASIDTCEIEGGRRDFSYVEITRIFVDIHERKTGVFTSFLEKMQIVCARLQKILVLGCVSGNTMKIILRDHPCLWVRLASDPTSYAYAPSLNLSFSSSATCETLNEALKK